MDEAINNFIRYEPSSGVFTYIKNIGYKKAGEVAGSICKTHGYRTLSFKGKAIRANRLAFLLMGIKIPEGKEIDHINGDRADDRWSNLRIATKQENSRNSKQYDTNTSGESNVYYRKSRGKFQVSFTIDGKVKSFGSYLSKASAVKRAKEVREELYKEFGREVTYR